MPACVRDSCVGLDDYPSLFSSTSKQQEKQ